MIVTALCDSYKAEIIAGVHAVDDEYRLALYSPEANLDRSTAFYSANGEVTGEGYDAGGIVLAGASVRSINGAACLAFDSVEWPRTTISAAGGAIYNASKQNRTVAVFNFGEVVQTRNGRFSVKIPAQLIGIK